MVRQKVEVRREEILVATISEIEARGMSTVRVADVAASLGVSTGLVFYHFDTKDALLVEALEFAVERDLRNLHDNLAQGGTPIERLRRVISIYGPGGRAGAAEAWTLWIDAWATGLREPTIRQAMRKLDSRWREELLSAIEHGIETGDFRCADPRAAVSRIGSLIDGLSVAVNVYESIEGPQLVEWVRHATATELGLDPAVLA